jgi:hypothetical protein
MDRGDVFISYRRTNIEFVRRLHQALESEALSVWVDWEDILPASPSYVQDIHSGIDGTHAFVAVFSPDYFESEHCLAELQHAIDNNKRIVPIVYEKGFDEAAVPARVSPINRVFFCPHIDEQNDFDAAFPRLLAGIQINHDYLREHTQYLVQARRWDDNERDPSYLLMGTEIDAAEKWLVEGATAEPDPTPLQVEYIVTSHQADTERRAHQQALERKARVRQRNFFLVLFGGLLLMLVLLVGAVNESEQSSIQLAEQNLQTLLRLGAAEIDKAVFQELVLQLYEGRDLDPDLYQMHVADLERLVSHDPSAFPYSVTSDYQAGVVVYLAGTELAGEVVEVAADDEFWTRALEPRVVSNSFREDDKWVMGWIDIPGDNGNIIGTLILELRADQYFQVTEQLTTRLGFVGIALFAVTLFFAWRSIWRMFGRLRRRLAGA